MEYIVMANIPDIAPNPTKITKNIAHIKDGKLLRAARMKRITAAVRNVLTFLAAISAMGSEMAIASIVQGDFSQKQTKN